VNTLYGYIAALVVIIFLAAGWAREHDKRIVFEAQIAQAAQDAERRAAEINAKYQEEMKNAEQNTITAANAIADWYRAHPVVRVQHSSCGQVPGSADSSQGADGTSPSGYVSPYSPEETEQVANRLDQLQKLLRADGVRVE